MEIIKERVRGIEERYAMKFEATGIDRDHIHISCSAHPNRNLGLGFGRDLYHVKNYSGFVARMGKSSAEIKPSIGLFGHFIVEKSGEHKNALDIQLRGCLPILEGVRALTLVEGIRETNTSDRIEAMAEVDVFSKDEADEFIFAYQFLLTLRMRNHFSLLKGRKPLHNYVDPSCFTKWERRFLKDYFAFHLPSPATGHEQDRGGLFA